MFNLFTVPRSFVIARAEHWQGKAFLCANIHGIYKVNRVLESSGSHTYHLSSAWAAGNSFGLDMEVYEQYIKEFEEFFTHENVHNWLLFNNKGILSRDIGVQRLMLKYVYDKCWKLLYDRARADNGEESKYHLRKDKLEKFDLTEGDLSGDLPI